MATRTELDLIIRARDEATVSLKKVAGSVDELGQKTSGLSKIFDNIGIGAARVLGGMVVAGATAAAAGVAAFGVSSINAAATFEQSLSSIEAVSGATAAQMESISALALQLGSDTAFSAQEAAAGFEELIKGGLSVADAMAAAKPMLDLAAAGGIGVADAAEIAANAIGIFSLKGSDMENVANQIAGAANASSLSVSDFQFSMAAAGSVAAGVGQSFDDLATAIAVMGKSGIKGSDAGTSLKTMLMNLQPTTKAQVQTFKDLGIVTLDNQKLMEAFAQQGLDPALAQMEDAEEILKKQVTGWDGVKAMTTEQKDAWANASRELGIYNNAFLNADGSFKSMAEIAEVLQNSTGGLTDAQRALALETMFGSDAIRAANIMVKEGAEGFDAMAASMGNVTAASVAATRMDNFKGAIDAMKGSLETFQIVIGTAVLPILSDLVTKYITPAINGATKFANAFFESGDKIGFLVSAIDEVLPGFQELIGWLTQNWTMITQVATAVGAAVAAFAGLMTVASIVGSIAVAWGTLTGAIATSGTILGGIVAILGGPVTVAIGLVAAAVGALYLAWTTDFMGIQTILTAWWAGTGQPIFNQIVTWLGTNIPVAIGVLVGFWNGTLYPALQTVGSFIMTTIVPAFVELELWFATNIPTAIQALAGFWTGTLQPAIATVGTFITGTVIPTLTTLATTVFGALQTGLSTLATFWTGTLLPAITTVWNFVNGSVVPLLTSLANVTIAALGVALTAMAGIWQNVVQPALQAVWEKANEVATLLSGALSTAIQVVSDWFNSTLLPAVESAGNTIGTVLGPAITTVTGFFETWYTAIGGVSGAISTVIGWLDNLAGKLDTIKLPDWMTPGSPTPWEIGMVGVAKSVAYANREVQSLGSTLNRLDGKNSPAANAKQEIEHLLKTGDFRGGIFGLNEDDPFIDFLFRAREDTKALAEVMRLLQTGDFRGGILGLQEDDPLIAFLLRATEGTRTLTDGLAELPKTAQKQFDETLAQAALFTKRYAKWMETINTPPAGYKRAGQQAGAKGQQGGDYGYDDPVGMPIIAPDAAQAMTDSVTAPVAAARATVEADTEAIKALWSEDAWAPVVEAVRVTWQTITIIMHDQLAMAWAYQDSVTSLMGSDISTVMKKIDALIGKINSIPSIPSGGSPAPLGGDIPSFARGGTNFRGGLAYVHQGEMLVNASRGTDVITKRDVSALMASSGQRGTTINGGIHITLGPGAARDQAASFLDELRYQGVDL